MPHDGFVLQTGGSARRPSIRTFGPDGATTGEYRVSGVPQHTHNSSAVISVLCNLERRRGFTQNLTNAWHGSAENVNLAAADLGERYEALVLDYNGPRWGEAAERGLTSAEVVKAILLPIFEKKPFCDCPTCAARRAAVLGEAGNERAFAALS